MSEPVGERAKIIDFLQRRLDAWDACDGPLDTRVIHGRGECAEILATLRGDVEVLGSGKKDTSEQSLTWTGKLPSAKGIYVWRRKGCAPSLVWIHKDCQSGELYFDDYCGGGGRAKCFRRDWPTDRVWFGPLPKGRWPAT